MPQSIRKLRERFSQAIANDDESQLWRTWEEFEYRVDICRVTNGAHIEHLEINFMCFHAISFCILTVSKIQISFHPNYQIIYNSSV
jgi:hypothetical protein